MQLRYMDPQTGHTVIEADPTVKEELDRLEAEFDRLLKGTGRQAYVETVENGVKVAEPITKFDPKADSILITTRHVGG